LFEEHCGSCHEANRGVGSGSVYPSLHAYSEAVRERLPGVDLRRHTLLSILDPDREIRPGFTSGLMSVSIPGRLTDEDIVDIANYVLRL
jgi:mono/diheme cytochrome c family protein